MAKFHPYLPPLRKKIVSRFLIIAALYAVFGIVMILAVLLTSKMTPKLIHVNYDSIAAERQMSEAWQGIVSPKSDPSKTLEEHKRGFEAALNLEEHNVTEPGEGEIAKNVRTLWRESQSHLNNISPLESSTMKNQIKNIVEVNESGMFRIAEESSTLAHEVFLGGVVFLIITLFVVVFVSNGVANRLAYPLKAIAETLRSRPNLGSKLKLPNPTSLELKILNHEMIQMWNNLSQLRQLNVEEINTQRNQLKTILTFVEDGILVLDNEGIVLHANPGLHKFINLSLEEIIGHPWNDLSSTSDNYLQLRSVLRPEVAQHHETQIIVDGHKKALSIRFRKIENETGHVTGKLYLLHDVTERRQTEKLRREFIGVLSHELKTPLQSLSVCSQLMNDHKPSLNEDGKLLVDTINEDVSRIRAVANDFIQVGVENLNSLKLFMERIDLGEFLPQWLKPFIVLARDKKISVEFLGDSHEKFQVKVDQVKFPWVISNILANSIRISEPNTTIKVSLSQTEAEVLIEIADQGPGIPIEVQKRMFEAYYQAPNETGEERSTGFLGIGLTIAREVVEAHNGMIKFTSNFPTGAIFRVSLPRLHLPKEFL